MADDNNERILYSADFDATAFVKGIDATIAATQKLRENTDNLSKTIQEQSKQFDLNNDKLNRLEAQLGAMSDTEKETSVEAKKLTDQIKSLSGENDKLYTSLKTNSDQFDKQVAQHKTLQDAYARTQAVAQKFQETTGKPISIVLNDNAVMSKLQGLKQSFDKTFGSAGPLLAAEEMQRLDEAVINSKGEFEQISKTVDVLKDKLLQLEPGTQEFNELSGAVRAGNAVLAEYTTLFNSATKAVDDAAPKYVSLRTQIMNARNALAQMEDQGLANTKQYRDQQVETGKLMHQYEVIQAQIRILASSSRSIDFGVSAIRAGAAGFQTYLGAMELFGVKSESAAEAQRKLLAVMNLVQGIEQLNLLLNEKSIIRTELNILVTNAYAAAKKLLGVSTVAATVAEEEATIATEAWAAALVATGIGAIIVGVGLLVAKLIDYSNEQHKVNQFAQDYNDIMQEANKNAGNTISDLQILYSATQNVTLSEQERVKAAKELNKEFPETFKNYTTEQILLGQAKGAYDDLTKSIYKNAEAMAAKNKIEENAGKILDEETQQQKIVAAASREIQQAKQLKGHTSATLYGADVFTDKDVQEGNIKIIQERTQKALDASNKRIKDYQDNNKNIVNLVGAGALVDAIVDDDKTKDKLDKKTKDVENVFAQKLAELKTKIAEITKKTFTDDDTIRAAIAAEYQKGLVEINNIPKNKITEPQRDILKQYLGILNDDELKKELGDYFDKVRAARQKLDDELTNQQFDEAGKNVANIRDEFDRQAAEIDLQYQKQARDIEIGRNNALAGLDKDMADGLFGNPNSPVTQQAYQKAKQGYIDLYGKMHDDLVIATANQKQDLSAKAFQGILGNIDEVTDRQNNALSYASTQKLTQITNAYLTGKINYESYQKQLTKISDDETAKRLHNELLEIQQQQAAIALRQSQSTISSQRPKPQAPTQTPGGVPLPQQAPEVTDTSIISDPENEALNKQYEDLQKKAADLQKQLDALAAGEKKTANNQTAQKLQKLADYAALAGQVANSIVQAWSAANEAEQKALDRSIALQDRRVQEAEIIAQRGNASYLKQEEDKQKQLILQQENAARRQMAINAALQASQLLVAVTGAAAQIAKGGPFNVIAGIATIVGALAAGYGLVKSLEAQQNQVKFAEGTTNVRRDATSNISKLDRKGEPAGRDTIAAWLDEGEAVTDAKTNALYHPTIKAIHEGRIPASVINGIVNTYPTFKMPRLNTDRIMDAVNVHVMQDNRQLEAIHENTREVKKLQKLMKSAKVEVGMNAKEFSVAVTGWQVQQKINKKS